MSAHSPSLTQRTPARLGRFALVTLLLGGILLGGAACSTSSDGKAEQPSYHAAQSSAPVSSYRTAADGRPAASYRSTYEPAYRLDRLDQVSPIQRLDRLPPGLELRTPSVLVLDERGNRLYAKNTRRVRPIASVTKLMTAMVVLDTAVSMRTPISIIEADRDRLKNSRSRLRIGQARLPRDQMMMVALMSSDNRAAHALSRTTYRGGTPAFVRAMNRKARMLGMRNTLFVDPTGLDPRNRSTAEDLAKMVRAAARYPFIHRATSRGEMTVYPFADRSPLRYRNTNPLVRNPDWTIDISKTGFINEAGRCLVMQTRIGNRPLTIVLLGASGKGTPVGDSNRLRDWMLGGSHMAAR